jgi:hypothetical protein
MAEILRALKDAGVLSWLKPSDIQALTRRIEIRGERKKGSEFTQASVGFSVYDVIGPPPDVDVAFIPDGTGLDGVIRQSTLATSRCRARSSTCVRRREAPRSQDVATPGAR